jgi:hypothetical protein
VLGVADAVRRSLGGDARSEGPEGELDKLVVVARRRQQRKVEQPRRRSQRRRMHRREINRG